MTFCIIIAEQCKRKYAEQDAATLAPYAKSSV